MNRQGRASSPAAAKAGAGTSRAGGEDGPQCRHAIRRRLLRAIRRPRGAGRGALADPGGKAEGQQSPPGRDRRQRQRAQPQHSPAHAAIAVWRARHAATNGNVSATAIGVASFGGPSAGIAVPSIPGIASHVSIGAAGSSQRSETSARPITYSPGVARMLTGAVRNRSPALSAPTCSASSSRIAVSAV